jgi:hypothetical protein
VVGVVGAGTVGVAGAVAAGAAGIGVGRTLGVAGVRTGGSVLAGGGAAAGPELIPEPPALADSRTAQLTTHKENGIT